MSTNCSSDEFRRNVKTFYWDTWGADIAVIRTLYDVNGDVTTVWNDTVKVVFTIQVKRALTQASANLIAVNKVSTTSTF